MNTCNIYCCECRDTVVANLASGKAIYPHRTDLHNLNFWKCTNCNNYVGCHKGTSRALGTIPNKLIRELRSGLHAVIDPIWKNGKLSRSQVYKFISERVGYEYHTANVSTVKDAKAAQRAVQELIAELDKEDAVPEREKKLRHLLRPITWCWSSSVRSRQNLVIARRNEVMTAYYFLTDDERKRADEWLTNEDYSSLWD